MRPASRTSRRVLLPVAITAALAAAAAAALLPYSSAAPSAAAAADGLPHTVVEVSPGACGHGWDRPHAGRQVFDLRNTSSDAAEVYLTDASSGALLGEVEGLAPGVQRPLQVVLGRGSYVFRCLPEDADAVTGPTVRITAGPATGGPAVLPVTEHDLIPPTLEYQKWVGQGLGRLVGKADALRDAVDRGDLAAARTAWLDAHLAYSRLGAAYGAFGDLGDAVDGLADGRPGGVKDQDFTGFHRIEYGLWHHEAADRLRAPARRLADDVRKLRDRWADARMEPADLGVRAHEITEDTVTFELTGHSDYGSGSSLATARAQLDGTAEVLDRLRPLLEPRDPELPGIDRWLARTRDDLDALRHDGTWPAPGDLQVEQRERVDADFGGLVERLAGVAAVCDVRRTS
ncbi:EfeM/EfeO family lipoprotein [Peterkaempfera griseoplana]|uniref:EfeM/EfeO family lipoprotein n=1 Tax=Peterkaempfera griseoplana TaxID=66896 RepID=UPI0006E46548|nr:EfeM/EfeO family lipoprotein [Peterkaempfera griseoplana]